MEQENKNAEKITYRLEIEHDRQRRRSRVVEETVRSEIGPLFECKEGEVQLYRDNHSEGPKFSVDWTDSTLARIPPRRDNRKLTSFLNFMRKLCICGVNPKAFQTESSTQDVILDRDGRNFAAWYHRLVVQSTDRFESFRQLLQEVIPGFQSIRMVEAGLDTYALILEFKQDGERYSLRLDEIADGHRVLMVLYAMVSLAFGQGYALFLDEPDNYVGLAELQPWLIALKDACGVNIPQAVLCSHHPELIDYLGPDYGVLLERERSGPTKVRPLGELVVDDGLKLSERIARGWVSMTPPTAEHDLPAAE